MQAVLRGAATASFSGAFTRSGVVWPDPRIGQLGRRKENVGHLPEDRAENLNRNWQNGALWSNDPEAVTLTGELPEEEYRFHATIAVAAGGLVLSGDDLLG